jgi:hypothetical protein
MSCTRTSPLLVPLNLALMAMILLSAFVGVAGAIEPPSWWPSWWPSSHCDEGRISEQLARIEEMLKSQRACDPVRMAELEVHAKRMEVHAKLMETRAARMELTLNSTYDMTGFMYSYASRMVDALTENGTYTPEKFAAGVQPVFDILNKNYDETQRWSLPSMFLVPNQVTLALWTVILATKVLSGVWKSDSTAAGIYVQSLNGCFWTYCMSQASYGVIQAGAFVGMIFTPWKISETMTFGQALNASPEMGLGASFVVAGVGMVFFVYGEWKAFMSEPIVNTKRIYFGLKVDVLMVVVYHGCTEPVCWIKRRCSRTPSIPAQAAATLTTTGCTTMAQLPAKKEEQTQETRRSTVFLGGVPLRSTANNDYAKMTPAEFLVALRARGNSVVKSTPDT